MERAALGLKALIPELDVLAASPYKRAFEAAEIIASAYGDLTIERVAELTPGASVDRVVAWLTGRHARGSVGLVGHEPDLSRLVCTLLADTSRPFLELRKGAACLLDRKSTRLNSSHGYISYAVFCLKKKKNKK